MAIKALSYIGVNSEKFEDWSDYTQKSLGMQQVDRGKDILSFRMDDQKQRLTITGDTGDGLGFMGWEVDEKEDLLFFWSNLYCKPKWNTLLMGSKIKNALKSFWKLACSLSSRHHCFPIFVKIYSHIIIIDIFTCSI